MTSSRSGVGFGLGAYALWGLVPLYLKQLADVRDVEILAHRISWSLVIVLILLAATRGMLRLGRLHPRSYGMLALAAAFITVNWGVYIWAVNSDQIVEASLGYFINPLVTVVLGVAVLGERLRRPQVFALAIAAVAVIVLTVDYGRPPWIALTLACSFGSYGLIKKRAGVGAVESLGVETAVLFLPAAAYLVTLDVRGGAAFVHGGWDTSLLLAGCGLVTAIPLLLFGAATARIPLTTLGPLQYLTPTLQFLLGVAVYDEQVPAARLAGFTLIWFALAVLTAEALRYRHKRRRVAEPVLRAEVGQLRSCDRGPCNTDGDRG